MNIHIYSAYSRHLFHHNCENGPCFSLKAKDHTMRSICPSHPCLEVRVAAILTKASPLSPWATNNQTPGPPTTSNNLACKKQGPRKEMKSRLNIVTFSRRY